nr:ATP-binding protein [Elusimicrobiota bacterium]
AWVARPDTDLGRFVAVCSAGHVDGYLERVKITINGEKGKGPTATSFRTGGIAVCPDIASDQRMAPWREEALRRAYRSSASIPLSIGEKVIFTLNMYSSETGFFVPEEMQLLSEIQGDISFALEALDNETKRAAAQAALERTAAHLAHVMDVTPVMLLKLRFAGSAHPVLEWVSGNTVALTGYAPEEVLAPGWVKRNMHPDDLATAGSLGTIFEKKTLTRDFRFRHKNGGYFWVHAQLRLTSPDEAIGSWTDISRLKESEGVLQELIDASPYGVVLRDGRAISYVNRSGLEIMRAASEKDFVGHSILERIPERYRPEIERRMAEVDQGLPAPPVEIEVTAMDGRTVPLELHSRRIQYGGKKTAVVFFLDLTAKKNSDSLMREMLTMQRVESLGLLAGGIAHDFNNMLMGIMANISLLEKRCPLDKETVEILKDTLAAAGEAKSLTSNLLAFSKGGKPVKKEMCLEKALRDIFSLSTRGASAAAELDISEALWSVNGDEGQLKQAVGNLLINAVQAMPKGGTLRLEARNLPEGSPLPGLLPSGKYVRITVSDTGIGIPGEYLGRIFEPYFSTKKKGHGLGLSMAWSVVKNHGGHITAASVPGKGSTFDIYLPASGRCLRTAPESATEVLKGTGRILVLEDEEIVIGAVRRMLRELGYECEIVQDGRDALRRYAEEKAAGRPFDAVIMDLTIPGGMGGKEAVAELRRTDPSARVIASSGYSDDAAMAAHAANGFDAVLPKPYKFEELAAALRKLLAGGQELK